MQNHKNKDKGESPENTPLDYLIENGLQIQESEAFYCIVELQKESLKDEGKLKKLVKNLKLWQFEEASTPKPIVYIGPQDIMAPWEETHLTPAIEANRKIIRKGKPDSRFRFFDSSIWHRYLPSEAEDGRSFSTRLAELVEELKQYHDSGLYNSVVAWEYLEFSYRQFENSYLNEFDSGGHASAVVPFLFHSETHMKQDAAKRRDEIKAKGLKWDILLIDDYAETNLRPEKDGAATTSKKAIIEKELSTDIVNIFTQTDLSKAKEEIARPTKENQPETTSNKVYDIILLDYLFSHIDEKELLRPKYGVELLEKIDRNEITYGKAINGKYWIFPVSVFSEAMASSLRQKGIQHQERHWVLARGADPINTPQLFRASFLEFMQLQYHGLEVNLDDLIDLLVHQYPMKDSQGKVYDARPWARNLSTVLANRYGSSNTLNFNSAFKESATEVFQLNISANRNLPKPRMLVEQLEVIIHNLAFATLFDTESTIQSFKSFHDLLMEEVNNMNHPDKEKIKEQLALLGEGIFGIQQTY